MSCKTPSRFGYRFAASSKPGAGNGIISWIAPLIILPAIILPGLFFAGCGGGDGGMPEFPPARVTVTEAESQDVPVYLDEVGKCVALESVSIQPQVSGRITGIHFKDGAELKKGDPLFTIDQRPYKAALDLAEANLAKARADLDLAKIQFARVEDLADSRAVARQEYDTRKNAVAVAAALVEQSQAELDSARIDYDYTTIDSPIDGRAGHRLVDVGNVVTANTTTLLTIQRLDPIYAEFTVTESDLGRVRQHMEDGTLRVEVRIPEEPDTPLQGELTFLDNAVSDPTGTVKLRATVPNLDRKLWPGQFVKVRLVLDTKENAVLVPSTAVQDSAQGNFVYVVKEDSTAELRPVRVGQRQGDLVVLEEGVKAGERVVLTGQLAVAPGAGVTIVEEGGQGGGAEAAPGGGM